MNGTLNPALLTRRPARAPLAALQSAGVAAEQIGDLHAHRTVATTAVWC
jgi:hypothetical protein